MGRCGSISCHNSSGRSSVIALAHSTTTNTTLYYIFPFTSPVLKWLLSAPDSPITFPVGLALTDRSGGSCFGGRSGEGFQIQSFDDLRGDGVVLPPNALPEFLEGDGPEACICLYGNGPDDGIRHDLCAPIMLTEIEVDPNDVSFENDWSGIAVNGDVGLQDESFGFHLRSASGEECGEILVRSLNTRVVPDLMGSFIYSFGTHEFWLNPNSIEPSDVLDGDLCLCLSNTDRHPITPPLCTRFTGSL